MKKEHISVGKSVEKIDSYAKVTGKATYVADMQLDNMLYGKCLRSPFAHAKVKSIDVSRARALPGVAAVLTFADVPQVQYSPCGHPMPYDTPLDMRVLTDQPRYVGDPIAAVAAESDELAEEALRLIDVEYEELPFYTDPIEAMADGAYLVHEDHPNNICNKTEFEIGDVAAAFEAADMIVEDEFKLPIVTHCPIENHVSLVDIDHRGRLTFYVSNQVPNIMRERLAKCLELKPRDIRVIKQFVGGGFGGKQEPVYEPINGVLTLATKRPVLMELTREEELSTTRTRHSGIYKMRTALKADGTMIGRTLEAIHNTGAYSSHGHEVIGAVSGQFGNMYPCPNVKFTGISVYTNILIAAAMRGYGIPQLTFCTESHIEHIAAKLGVDSVDYRLQHIRRIGDPQYSVFNVRTTGLREAIEWCREKIGYDEFQKLPKQEGDIRRGIGMSAASYGLSCYPFSVELSTARITVHEDASATLYIGCTDIGQGADTVMAQIASEALGIPFSQIEVVEGDTDICPFDCGAYASRQTYVTGNAVKKAGIGCKNIILERAAKLLTRNQDTLDTYDGYIVDSETLEQLMPIADVTYQIYYDKTDCRLIECNASHSPDSNGATFITSFAEVEVDMKTGQVNVLKFVVACDCGKLINPLTAMSQLTGGSIMAYGYGLTEQILIDTKTGRVLNNNMLDYKVPTFADLPDMEAHFVETDEKSGAYGNKVLGEPPMHTPAPTIRNAVYNATGVAINENPLTPERVFLAIQAAQKNEAAAKEAE